MPFDGLLVRTLDDILASINIQPVPESVLEQHKTAELAKHPGSFFWRHPKAYDQLGMCCFAGMVVFASQAIALAHVVLVLQIGCVLSLGCCVMLLKLLLFTTKKAPAEWHERLYVEEWEPMPTMPMPLVRLVALIRNDATLRQEQCLFTVGTLVQEQISLDPYLLVTRYNRFTEKSETACLGIWDGEKIIELAQG